MSFFRVKANHGRSAHWHSVRGFSILAIALIHTEILLGWRPFGLDLVNLSYPIIEPIIFLSGFLICQRSFQLASLNEFTASAQVKNYFLRRVIRTWPLYYAVVAICFLFPMVVEAPITQSLFSFLTFTMNLDLFPSGMSHIWSLCIEEICYLMFLFVIPWIRWRYIGYVFLALCLLPLVGRTYISLTNPPFDLFTYMNRFWYPTFWHWDAFWYGCIAGLFYQKRNLQNLTHSTRLIFLGCAVLWAAVYITLNSQLGDGFKVVGQITNPLWGVVFSVFMILGIEAIPIKWLWRLGLVWLGEVSYTLYLIHKLVIHNVAELNRHYGLLPAQSVSELALCWIALLLVGATVYWTCERPLLWFLRHHVSLKPKALQS